MSIRISSRIQKTPGEFHGRVASLCYSQSDFVSASTNIHSKCFELISHLPFQVGPQDCVKKGNKRK